MIGSGNLSMVHNPVIGLLARDSSSGQARIQRNVDARIRPVQFDGGAGERLRIIEITGYGPVVACLGNPKFVHGAGLHDKLSGTKDFREYVAAASLSVLESGSPVRSNGGLFIVGLNYAILYLT